jgi:hypothetical protein
MLPETLLKEYADKFYGFGTWKAKIWFIGIEEAGGWSEGDVQSRLDAWRIQKPDLADAPAFYPACGQHGWHGDHGKPQATWTQLIRMLLVARGIPDTPEEILRYQREKFGKSNGRECLAELFPLPSPSITVWHYNEWSDLPQLQSRTRYQSYFMLVRAARLQQRIKQNRPKVVVFYGSSLHRIWAMVARGEWSQAINGSLMGMGRDGISFYVTRHPRAETDEYFREVGRFLRNRHHQ